MIMATWKNLDTLASYSKLNGLKDHVNIAEAMSGEQGAERVKKYRRTDGSRSGLQLRS